MYREWSVDCFLSKILSWLNSGLVYNNPFTADCFPNHNKTCTLPDQLVSNIHISNFEEVYVKLALLTTVNRKTIIFLNTILCILIDTYYMK